MKNFEWFRIVQSMLIIVLLALMFANVACAEVYTVAIVEVNDGLNVRVGPGLEHRVSFMLSDGAEVVVLDSIDDWALVNFRGLLGKREPFGWVNMEFLTKFHEVNIK